MTRCGATVQDAPDEGPVTAKCDGRHFLAVKPADGHGIVAGVDRGAHGGDPVSRHQYSVVNAIGCRLQADQPLYLAGQSCFLPQLPQNRRFRCLLQLHKPAGQAPFPPARGHLALDQQNPVLRIANNRTNGRYGIVI